MATQTTNYNLVKPDYTDPVDVGVLNTNADLIDSALTEKANLVGGKVPASELPSYVDDVIEGYYYNGAFYEDSAHTTQLTGEAGKIYVDLDTENCYRWSGSVFIQISSAQGTITDVQDEQGNSLVSEGIAVIPTGEMLEIVESAEQGVVISKYSRSEIYDLYTEGKALCCQGFPISTVVRGDNYYLYFISGGYNDTPYLSRREVKSDKTITSAQLVGYFTEREYTAAKDTKLSGIAAGAEVNVIDTIKDSNGNPLTVTSKAVTLPAIPDAQVQADWNESDNTKADYIKNKPTIPDISGKEDTANKVTSLSSSSTDTEYPSAKAVYDALPNIPDGTNNGDILVWDGDEWVTKPKWQMIYQPVEYIESTGTQCIDTGIIPTASTEWELKVSDVTNTTEGYFLGADYNSSNKFSFLIYSNTWYGNIGSTGSTGIPFSASDDYLCSLKNGTLSINENQVSLTGSLSTAKNLILLASANKGAIQKCRLYYSKLWNSGNLVRDYIPVRNVFTGEGGLYDLVNGKFYGNAGTGSFVIGADVN